MLGPAERAAGRVAWAWWARCDTQLRPRPWASGNACRARSASGAAEAGWARAAAAGPVAAREEGGNASPGAAPGSRGEAPAVPYGRGHACAQGDGSTDSAAVLLAGFGGNGLELDGDVLVGICGWGKGRTMLRLEAKGFQ